MAKIVNCWNEWDPLKYVVVGRPEGTSVTAPGPDWMYNMADGGVPLGYWKHFPQEYIDQANEQMDAFIKIMQKNGVEKVDRITIHPSMLNDRPIVHPDWTQINQHGWNNPRDLYMPLGNELMEAPGSRRSRYYEYLGLRPLVEKWFKEDPEFLWTAAPRPWLSDESFVDGYYWDYAYVWDEATKKEKMLNKEYHLTEKEPLWDAADALRCGKDIFWQPSAVTNRGGMEWLRRYLTARGFRLHEMQMDSSPAGYYRPWHIDVVVNTPRPGLLIVSNKKKIMDPKIVDLFTKNDWEIVPAVDPEYQWNETFTLSATPQGKGVQGPNWISMNTFILAPDLICVSDKELGYMNQLDKLGCEVVPVAYEKVYKFGGMLHCTTLDIYREGKCEDYFPNQ